MFGATFSIFLKRFSKSFNGLYLKWYVKNETVLLFYHTISEHQEKG